MEQEKLIKNIIDQIKEAQIKLGYVKETVRLYYPVVSFMKLLDVKANNKKELLIILQEKFEGRNTTLGQLYFAVHGGRVGVSIPLEGVEYVHKSVKSPAFLSDMITLFSSHHHCTLEEIGAVFQKYSNEYICEKMPEDMDFDYVFYFKNEDIDPYYYCVKEEMGHTIYHRFTKEDYEVLRN